MVILRWNKFQFELHPHPRGKALEHAKRRICGSAFELADVCLVNARDIRQLLLRQMVFLAPFNDGTDDLFLRLQSIPRRRKRWLLSLFQHRVVQT